MNAITREIVDQLVITLIMKGIDHVLQKNAEAAENAGMEVKVSRKYDGKGLSGGRACEWCLERECDDLSYQEAYDLGAFERHEGCGCVITYTSARGELTWQNKKGGWNKVPGALLQRAKVPSVFADPETLMKRRLIGKGIKRIRRAI